MPHSDPEKRDAYNRERWRTHGHIYRAQRSPAKPPISRQQVLNEDVAQARALAGLEARRIGLRRAEQHFASWLSAERRWIRQTSAAFVIGGLDAAD